MPILQNMKTRNDGRELLQNQCISAPPTHHADSLAHRQSENPMAQTSDGQPPQTSHVQSDQTTSVLLRKLPTQLNTPNSFVSDPVRVSPNYSDVKPLGQCIPALTIAAAFSAITPYEKKIEAIQRHNQCSYSLYL